jgi:phenylacetate-CoA ligase
MDGSSISGDQLEKNIYWKKKSEKEIPYGSMALSSLYLNEETVPRYFDFINTFKPAIIRGYPAFVNDVAAYMLKNKIKLDHPLKGIVLTSESSNSVQIDTIAASFNTKIYLQYGHSEASLFAYTIDDSYQYYCSPYYGYVEILNESGEHVKPGELGEVVCTGFYNYAMPFIRYRTGDLAIFQEDRDGIVRLQSILGRTQDYVYDADNNKTLLTALVFGLHYKAFAHIKKWQIIQDELGIVTILIVKDELFDIRDEEEIRTNFLNIAKVTTKFEYVETIPLTKRGKSKFLVQNTGCGHE